MVHKVTNNKDGPHNSITRNIRLLIKNPPEKFDSNFLAVNSQLFKFNIQTICI